MGVHLQKSNPHHLAVDQHQAKAALLRKKNIQAGAITEQEDVVSTPSFKAWMLLYHLLCQNHETCYICIICYNNDNNLFLHSFHFAANHMLHNEPYATGNYNNEKKIKITMQSLCSLPIGIHMIPLFIWLLVQLEHAVSHGNDGVGNVMSSQQGKKLGRGRIDFSRVHLSTCPAK